MKPITVKFGTLTPIKFREYDEKYPEIDLDLEFRAAGTLFVMDHNDTIYGSDDEVSSKAREIALSSLAECVRTWPKGKSFWGDTSRAVLETYIDERLSEQGITAKTDLFSVALTSESKELYDAAVKNATEQKWFIDVISPYKDIIDANEGQPVIGNPLFNGLPMGKNNPFTPSSDDKGADIDGSTVMGIVPNGSPLHTANDRYCRFCGTKRKAGAKFCTQCGAKFD